MLGGSIAALVSAVVTTASLATAPPPKQSPPAPATAATATAVPTTAAVVSASLAEDVLEQLNEVREQHALVPLTSSSALAAAADQHSREMAAAGYFAHPSFDGSAFWKRVGRWYSSQGFAYWSVGENLLWASPDIDGPAAIDLWLHSPEHRANLLAPRWREVGLAAIKVQAAPGAYRGLPVTIVTADFGVRR